ncbi:MAG: cytochrome P450 [Ardenticatenaceae bacterium]|nr:cytochrome P450 [Ardenticatenaceae bacterium]MCB8975410.1 cytochrome P450 [Ardenticatenaceae bacterium]
MIDTAVSKPTCKAVNLSPLRIPEIQGNPLAFLQRNAAEHGDFIHYPLGLWEVFQLNHPDLIEHVLVTNQRNYSKNTVQYNTLAKITGRGLLTSDGRFWRRQRRMIQPAFHRQKVLGWGKTMTNAAQNMLAGWENAAQSSQPLDIDEEMMSVTLNIVGEALLGLDLQEDASQLTHAVLTMLDYVVYRSQQLVALPLMVPTPRNRRVRQGLHLLDNLIDQAIRDHEQGQANPDTILSQMITAVDRETNERMSRDELRDEVITLLVAGHETAASGLTWLFYLLSQNPAVEAELLAEIDGVLNGRPPTTDDLPSLPTVQRVIAEALRLYPPAWVITRRAVAADTLGGAQIPANALIIMSPYTMQRHPAFWENPDQFDPNHFTPEAEQAHPRYAYFPFGGGARLCIGDQFAKVEMGLVVTAVLQKYRLQLLPNHPVVADPLVTIRPKHGLMMNLERR